MTTSTPEPKTLFILGASGYIGGAVLKALHAAHPSLTISALVRQQTLTTPHARANLLAAGVSHILEGSHADHALILNTVLASDIVVNCADADDLDLTKVILKGMLARSEDVFIRKGGFKPILLHTSGTGVITDISSPPGSLTEFYKHKVYNDLVESDIQNIAPTQPHRHVDLEIFSASATNLINAFIIAPSTIYGRGDGPLRQVSQQVPKFIRAGIRRRQVVVVGEGSNVWNNVHTRDVTLLYVLVLSYAFRTQNQTISQYAKFYFGSAGEHYWIDVARLIAKELKKRGLVDSEEVRSVTREEERLTATNSRSTSQRGYIELGWIPTQPSLEKTIAEDVDATLEEDRRVQEAGLGA